MTKENKEKICCGIAISAVAVVGAFFIGMCCHKPTTMKVISCKRTNRLDGSFKRTWDMNNSINFKCKTI